MKASFFDIDGTLSKGFLMTGFSKHLVSRNLFPKENYSEMENWTKLYFENKTSYRKIAIELPKIYSISLKGRKKDKLKREAEIYVDKVEKRSLFPYTENLVNLMKNYGMTIGISGAPVEVVRRLGKHFNFDLSYGTELEVRDGFYTGKIEQNLVIKETKEYVLKRIIDENKVDLANSFGFGDTEQDLSFLSIVGHPIVLNPNQELFSIAKENGWKIFYPEDEIVDEIRTLIETKE